MLSMDSKSDTLIKLDENNKQTWNMNNSCYLKKTKVSELKQEMKIF